MTKGRMEAFSDGVLAIIITIMVLEMRVPHGDTIEALKPLLPVFISYVLSFVHLGIYWNNHHHMLHASQKINGTVLWANIHLLFWLSLIPFVTDWMGENNFTTIPVALYGHILGIATATAKRGERHHLLVRAVRLRVLDEKVPPMRRRERMRRPRRRCARRRARSPALQAECGGWRQ